MPGLQSPPTPFPAHVEWHVQAGLGEVERVEPEQRRLDGFASCPRTSRRSAPGHYPPKDLLSKCPRPVEITPVRIAPNRVFRQFGQFAAEPPARNCRVLKTQLNNP